MKEVEGGILTWMIELNRKKKMVMMMKKKKHHGRREEEEEWDCGDGCVWMVPKCDGKLPCRVTRGTFS